MLINYFSKKKQINKKKIMFDANNNYSLQSIQNNNINTKKYYSNNPIVFRCINIISYAISTVPIIVYYQDKKNKYKKENSKLEKLFNNPNPMQSKQEFFEHLVSNLLIHGDVFILKVKNKSLSELYVISPENISINQGSYGIPKRYIYTPNLSEKEFVFNVNKINGDSDVLHIKNFNPEDQTKGLSYIQVISKNILQYEKNEKWNTSLLDNSARPSGALVFKNKDSTNKLTEEQYRRLKRQIDDQVGNKNSGRPLLLEEGLQWQEMSIRPKDMDFLENKNSNARDIAMAFGVPPQMLGIPGENKYSNLIEARTFFWDNTILPLLDKIKSKLNHWLCNDLEKNVYFDFNKENIDVFIEKRKNIIECMNKSECMTINEKRKELDLPPIEGLDYIK